MDTIETVRLASLVLGSPNRPPLTPLAAAYISEYLPTYAVLSNHPKFNRLEIVVTPNSVDELVEWMQQHEGMGQRAVHIT
jgi:cellulase/cellobiase CelA1